MIPSLDYLLTRANLAWIFIDKPKYHPLPYQHPQLQNSQSYEVERRLLPQLLDNLAVWGEASLSLQPNQYPTAVLISWKFKLEMKAALHP